MLLDRDGEKADGWTRAEGAAIDNIDRAIVAWDALSDALAARRDGQSLGVAVPNTVTAAALAPHLDAVALVAVSFPAFSDGRGFSIAKALRNAGYTGTLRANGPLIPDQFAYALACGFDEVELPEASAARQSPEQWRRAARWSGGAYQRGYRREVSILDQRRAAREAAETRG